MAPTEDGLHSLYLQNQRASRDSGWKGQGVWSWAYKTHQSPGFPWPLCTDAGYKRWSSESALYLMSYVTLDKFLQLIDS